MRNVSESLAGGLKLSLTWTVTALLPGSCVTLGVQVKRPSVVMLAPWGAPAPRVKVRICGGESGSVAVVAKLSNVPGLTVLLPIAASTGGELERTMMVTLLEVAAAPTLS